LQPHEYERGGTAKLLTLFRPTTGKIQAKGVPSVTNAVLHPWLKEQLAAILAERERDAAARVAVAEEHARIARELRDIVAHALSVTVLQVGAVRHKLPDQLTEARDALRDVERAGRTALTEMRRLLAAMRREGDEAELYPNPGLTPSTHWCRESTAPGCPSGCTSRANPSHCHERSISRPIESSKKARPTR